MPPDRCLLRVGHMCDSGAGRSFRLFGRVPLDVTVATSSLATTTSAGKHVGRALTFRLAHPSGAIFAVPGRAVTGAIDTAVARTVKAAVPWALNRLPAATPMGQRLRPFNQECTGTSAGVQRELDALSKRRSFHHIDKGVEVMHILPVDSADPHSLAHTGLERGSCAIDPQDQDSFANCFVCR